VQRINDLMEPPVVGETYLVPCIDIENWDYTPLKNIPVMGTIHSDPELGVNADIPHIHLDQRFIDPDLINLFTYHGNESELSARPARNMHFVTGYSIPIVRATSIISGIVEKPKVCCRPTPTLGPYTVNHDGSVKRWVQGDNVDNSGVFEDKYENIKLKDCKVCPHRGIHLGSVPARGGLITCPGHGLDFDEQTGCVVRRTKKTGDDTYNYTYSDTLPITRRD
jgi:hypothetical protein